MTRRNTKCHFYRGFYTKSGVVRLGGRSSVNTIITVVFNKDLLLCNIVLLVLALVVLVLHIHMNIHMNHGESLLTNFEASKISTILIVLISNMPLNMFRFSLVGL